MDPTITAFWQHFLDHRSDLEAMHSADDPAYEDLLAALQRVDRGLYIQFCSNPGMNELIVTAEGETGLFPLVERIVSLAPAVASWKFFALKPKIGFPKFARWNSVTVEIGETIACPVFGSSTGNLGLQFYVPGVTPANKEEIHLALLQATDSGLGERRFATSIHFSEVHPVEDLPEGVTSFPLTELDRYLTSREERIAAKRAAAPGPEEG